MMTPRIRDSTTVTVAESDEVQKQDCTQSCIRSEFPKWEFGVVGWNIPS